MSKKHKVNPRRVPVSQADIDHAKIKAQQASIQFTTALVLTVLRDKFGFGPVRLKRVWGGVNDLADSVVKGYVTKADLERVLVEEAGITIKL